MRSATSDEPTQYPGRAAVAALDPALASTEPFPLRSIPLGPEELPLDDTDSVERRLPPPAPADAARRGEAPLPRSLPPTRITADPLATRALHAPDLDSSGVPVSRPPPAIAVPAAHADPRGGPVPLASVVEPLPAPRLVSLDRLRPLAGDSLPPIADESDPALAVARERPRMVVHSLAPAPAPSAAAIAAAAAEVADEERSTGVFESLEFDGESVRVAASSDGASRSRDLSRDLYDPPSEDAETRKPWENSAPSLSVVRSVADSIENEYVGMRAVPPPTEPRPAATEVVDWPPPMLRPSLDYPPDWSAADMGDTRIVLDPARPTRSRAFVFAVDAAAWLLGFAAMFLTGLVTTGSAALVLFAISI